MSQLKATPGPWKRVLNKFGESVLVQPATDRTLFLLDDGETTDWDADETEANARLIAAAPELYEALQEAVVYSEAEFPWTVRARAALAKARGEA
jgi:hypothetical protein